MGLVGIEGGAVLLFIVLPRLFTFREGDRNLA